MELPGFELEEGKKGKLTKETVLAVASSIRTNFGTQSTLILTTFRCTGVCCMSKPLLISVG